MNIFSVKTPVECVLAIEKVRSLFSVARRIELVAWIDKPPSRGEGERML